jgi:hypothetical protein
LSSEGNLHQLAEKDLELAISYLGAHYLSDEENFSNEIEQGSFSVIYMA